MRRGIIKHNKEAKNKTKRRKEMKEEKIEGLMDVIIEGLWDNGIDHENFFTVFDIEKLFEEIEEMYKTKLTEDDKEIYMSARYQYLNQ